jgi:hypothetical protein
LPKVEKAVIFFFPIYVPFFSMNETWLCTTLEAAFIEIEVISTIPCNIFL